MFSNFHTRIKDTHASVLSYKKVNNIYVSERLGHSVIETTYKVLFPRYKRTARRRETND